MIRDLLKSNLFLVSTNSNPVINHAIGSYLAFVHNKYNGANKIIFAHSSDPCISIGKTQDYLDEVNLLNTREDKVQIFRRDIGGPAFYWDNGSRVITCIDNRKAMDPNTDPELNKSNYKIIQNILGKFTKRSELIGSNIMVSDRIIGTSIFSTQTNSLTHTMNILVNIYTSNISEYLSYHSSSQYVNLSDLANEPIKLKEFDAHLLNEYQRVMEKPGFTGLMAGSIDAPNCLWDPDFVDVYNKLTNPKYIYNKQFRVNKAHKIFDTNYIKYPFGTMRVIIAHSDNLIIQAKVYSDSSDTLFTKLVERHLIGLEYSKDIKINLAIGIYLSHSIDYSEKINQLDI